MFSIKMCWNKYSLPTPFYHAQYPAANEVNTTQDFPEIGFRFLKILVAFS